MNKQEEGSLATKPTDEQIESLTSGQLPKERHYDGSFKFSEAQTKLAAALWLDHDYTTDQTRRMILGLDLVPETIIEAVADDITQPETRPMNKPTFTMLATKCWVAMLANNDLQQLLMERRSKHKAIDDDKEESLR